MHVMLIELHMYITLEEYVLYLRYHNLIMINIFYEMIILVADVVHIILRNQTNYGL